MSIEDDLEEVYHELCRTRSELDTQVMKEIMAKKEAEAKARARTQIYELLNRDLALARRWLYALGDHRIRMENRYNVAEGEERRPLITPLDGENMDETLKGMLDTRAEYSGCEKGNQHENGPSTDPEVGELVTRTARRLQSDAYRLQNLLALLRDRSIELRTEHVEWVVPYLEGQLKLLRGEYEYIHKKPVYADYDLDALASQFAITRKLSLEARKLLGRPQVDFDGPKFQGAKESSQDRSVTPATFQRERETSTPDSVDDQVSPKTPLLYPAHHADESMSFRMKEITQVENSQCNCDCHPTQIMGGGLDPKFNSEIKQLVEQVIKSKADAQARCSRVLGIGDSLLKTNASLRSRIQKQSKQLQREAKLRRMSENQISALSQDLKGEAVLEWLYMRGDVVAGNIKAEKIFQSKRNLLARQLREFDEWYRAMKHEEVERGMKPEESRIHGAHDDLMRHLERNIIRLEQEREEEWLEFVGGLDGFSESDIKIWKVLRGVTAWSEPVCTRSLQVAEFTAEHPTECLYCDKNGCLGCSGCPAEYDRPWLEL